MHGIRAIAILLVLFYHCSEVLPAKYLMSTPFKYLIKIVRNGWVGVDIFFVLSGFLIGGQLIKEIKTTGALNFKKFYLKRILRIFPAYYIALIIYIFVDKKYNEYLLIINQILYLHNYLGYIYGISWSLAIEEQFYLLLPYFLYSIRIFIRCNLKITFYIFCAVISLPLIFRTIAYFNLKNIYDTQFIIDNIYILFHTRLDELMYGVLASWLYLEKKATRLYSNIFFQMLLLIIIYSMIYISGFSGSAYKIIFQFSILGFIFSQFMITIMYIKKNIICRILQSSFFVFISKISYALYLYHEITIILFKKNNIHFNEIFNSPILNYFLYFIVIFSLTIIISLLSWYIVEYPFLKIKDKLT
ncbi:MAG TPA: acyltransferase [bacterium]|nr:acyltransferase [bacterium]